MRRQIELESRAAARTCAGANVAAVRPQNCSADRESETSADDRTFPLATLELFE
jgi:hypothetical protein